jgi:hypothetical protein
MKETTECDNCENVIISEFPQRETYLDVTIPSDQPDTFESHSFDLCSECRCKVVDWIEGTDHSETRVDLPDLDTAIEHHAGMYAEYKRLTKELQELKRGD